MNRQVIYTETMRCQDCYKCVRECPVKAIQILDGHARVVEDICILCGHCVMVCPQSAKKVRSDVERVRRLLELKPVAVASLAPSFAAEFSGCTAGQLTASIRKLGFAAVSETALGADLVSSAMRNELGELTDNGRYFLIGAACPAVVRYVSFYRPDLVPFLSENGSPMIVHARYLRSGFGENALVVFIGPCIAKKKEADESGGLVNAVLTFAELRQLFEEENIDPSAEKPTSNDTFFPQRPSKGELYPIEGGMIASIKQHGSTDVPCMSFSGMGHIQAALRDLPDGIPETGIFLELLACEGGCINGPCSDASRGTVSKRMQILLYEKQGESEPFNTEIACQVKHSAANPVQRQVREEEIRAALALVGKKEPSDELNCSGCGYDSCREFAKAIVIGHAEPTMCLSYMRNLAQKKANALLRAMPSAAVVVNADLKVIECNEPFVRILEKDAQFVAEAKPTLEGADLRKLLPFWERFNDVLHHSPGDAFIESDFRCGERILHGTIFSIEKEMIAGGLFQDITTPWIQKDRVIKEAKKVIRQNVRTVQKIAYLLGENAAESEAALRSIIESFGGEVGQ